MREILFRGIPKIEPTYQFFSDIWKKQCKNGWVYGSLIIAKDKYYICISALCRVNSFVDNGITSMVEVIPESVGEYTGLKDSYGKKIFEGDIVRTWDDVKGQIIYGPHIDDEQNADCQGWYWKGIDENDNILTLSLSDYWECHKIIGNIHDNPELMRGEEV